MNLTFDPDRFRRRGYEVLPGSLDPATRSALRDRALRLVEELDVESREGLAAVFSSRDGSRLDRYFLDSARAVRAFFEQGAWNSSGELLQKKIFCINKIGHALHEKDPLCGALGRDPRLHHLARAAGLAEPRQVQSMFLFKPPHIGGEVLMHQDATFLNTEPVTVVGLWFALEDANAENGCLWALPGRHELRRRFVRDGDVTAFVELDDRALDGEAIPLEVEAGTLVVLHGLLPHRSGPNHSDASRLAYALHLVDGRASWSADNWIPADPPFPPLPTPDGFDVPSTADP